jgi:hypothetical protein
MQDADLFLELAGIAGVFVGFGALIAIRSGGASEPGEVAPVRIVVAMGMLAIIGALAPVTLGRYDLTGHHVLALSSVIVVLGYLGVAFTHVRSPEYKTYATSSAWVSSGTPIVVVIAEIAAWGLLGGATVLAPIVIVLGLVPDLEAALYFTTVVLILLLGAWSLMSLVFAQRPSPSA